MIYRHKVDLTEVNVVYLDGVTLLNYRVSSTDDTVLFAPVPEGLYAVYYPEKPPIILDEENLNSQYELIP